ncbi:MAG: DUF1416 domain-containing protein [Micromonosporaceae bacterium]|nr:DUF1416 domain-containing protein [Micromonosporaceae bacterium]
MTGCAAPDQSAPLAGVDLAKETVITGVVSTDGSGGAGGPGGPGGPGGSGSGEPVAGAYVRLLDATGEFAAEVVSSPAGEFRFFAAPGKWTVRALSRQGNGDVAVTADRGLTEVSLTVSS